MQIIFHILAVGGSRLFGSLLRRLRLRSSNVKRSGASELNTLQLSHFSNIQLIKAAQRFASHLHEAITQEPIREIQTYSFAGKRKISLQKKGKRSWSVYPVVHTRRRFALLQALCCCQCWLGSRRECYCTPCNARVCLAGWMRSAALGVARVGGYFLEGSGQTIAFISCQCAKQNIQRKAKCAELDLFGEGMFRLKKSHQQEGQKPLEEFIQKFPPKKSFSPDLPRNRPFSFLFFIIAQQLQITDVTSRFTDRPDSNDTVRDCSNSKSSQVCRHTCV